MLSYIYRNITYKEACEQMLAGFINMLTIIVMVKV